MSALAPHCRGSRFADPRQVITELPAGPPLLIEAQLALPSATAEEPVAANGSRP